MKYKSLLTYPSVTDCVARIELPRKGHDGYVSNKRILRLLGSLVQDADVQNGYATYPVSSDFDYSSNGYEPELERVVADRADTYRHNAGTGLDPGNALILQLGPRSSCDRSLHLRLALHNFEDHVRGDLRDFLETLHSSLGTPFISLSDRVVFERFNVTLKLKGLELSDLKIDHGLEHESGYARVQYERGGLRKTVGHEFGDLLTSANFAETTEDGDRLVDDLDDWPQHRRLSIRDISTYGDDLPSLRLQYIADRPIRVSTLKAINPFNLVRLFQRENDAAWVPLTSWNPTRIWNQVLDKLTLLTPPQDVY